MEDVLYEFLGVESNLFFSENIPFSKKMVPLGKTGSKSSCKLQYCVVFCGHHRKQVNREIYITSLHLSTAVVCKLHVGIALDALIHLVKRLFDEYTVYMQYIYI